MKIISHRGYLDGPNEQQENNPFFILECINLGFDVEIDLRIMHDEFWLGHDYPKYKIDSKFLEIYHDNLVVHCKDLRTASKLKDSNLNWFMHDKDFATLTSKGWLWLYPEQYCHNGIILNFKDPEVFGYDYREMFGICTDYPVKYKNAKN